MAIKKKSGVDYDKVWEQDWKDITQYGPSYRTRYRLIRKLMKKHKLTHGDLLDAGCGDGTLLLSLQKEWPLLKLNGFDISDRIIQKNKSRIQLTVGDLTKKASFPKKRFDIIICSEVLEHITRWKVAVRNLTSLLKKDGHLIITSPYRMKHWTRHDDYARHVRRWEDSQLEKELEQDQVKVLESFTWGKVVYNTYYNLFLKQQDPKKLVESSTSGLKRKVFAPLLYHAFKLDDLFRTGGRTILIVGKKIKDTQ